MSYEIIDQCSTDNDDDVTELINKNTRMPVYAKRNGTERIVLAVGSYCCSCCYLVVLE